MTNCRVISCSNQKGGIGKTSINLNIASILASRLNKRILIVDMDGQANITTALGFNPDDFNESGMSVYDLLLMKDPAPRKFIIKTKIRNLDLIPSCQLTYTLDQELMNKTRREYKLDICLNLIKKEYDYIFVDTAPNLGMATFNSLVACNHIIIVYSATEFALDGISQLVNTIQEIQDDHYLNVNDITILGAVCNNYDSRTKIVNRKIQKELDNIKVIPRYFTSISETTEIKKSQFNHLPMIEFNPNHKVTKQFIKLATEVDQWRGK